MPTTCAEDGADRACLQHPWSLGMGSSLTEKGFWRVLPQVCCCCSELTAGQAHNPQPFIAPLTDQALAAVVHPVWTLKLKLRITETGIRVLKFPQEQEDSAFKFEAFHRINT